MSNGKKKRIGVAIFLTILILAVISLGVYFYLHYSDTYDFFQNTRNGMTIQAIFFDQDGNIIKGTPQTAVNGVPGLFYMVLQIRTTNTGNVPLTNVRLTESHSSEFTLALQEATAIQSNLAIGESNILQWNTANICTTDGQCGTSEKCVYTVDISPAGKYCLMDISNYLGLKQFGATITADYQNLQGQTQQVSTLVNLEFLFEQDTVVFRTNAVNNDYSASGNQIAVDYNKDGSLEAYTRAGSGLETTYSPSSFIVYTPDNKLVFKCFTDRVCISRLTGLNKDTTHSNLQRDYYDVGGTLPTTIVPTEPYRSENCQGHSPCQERYSIAVEPPPQTCGNNQIEGTELCDGTDLAGNDCNSINQGFDGGTLVCGGNCDAWDTSQCTSGGGGGFVQFRTDSLTYPSSQAIAFTSTCGSTLTKYGHESSSGNTAGTCSATMSSYSLCTGGCTLLLAGLPGGWLSGGEAPSLWRENTMEDSSYELWICDDDGTNKAPKRYDDDDCPGDCGLISDLSTSVNPSYEVTC